MSLRPPVYRSKLASNVINGSGRTTDETRTKVETVIKDLGDRVNVAALQPQPRSSPVPPPLPCLFRGDSAHILAELADPAPSRPARSARLLRIRHHVCGGLRQRRARPAQQLQLHRVRRHDPLHAARWRTFRPKRPEGRLPAGHRRRPNHVGRRRPTPTPDDVCRRRRRRWQATCTSEVPSQPRSRSAHEQRL